MLLNTTFNENAIVKTISVMTFLNMYNHGIIPNISSPMTDLWYLSIALMPYPYSGDFSKDTRDSWLTLFGRRVGF